MKTLIIVAHPNLETSTVNQRWVEELRTDPEKYTVHDIYQAYPDGVIDVEREQRLIASHDQLILQFPMYWFNSPPLLKQWLDDVFTYGWAYGTGGNNLADRKVGLAVSAGIREADYTADGRYRYTLEQILTPFETTFLYCKADYRSFFAYYGTEGESSESTSQAPARHALNQSAQAYLNFIDNLS